MKEKINLIIKEIEDDEPSFIIDELSNEIVLYVSCYEEYKLIMEKIIKEFDLNERINEEIELSSIEDINFDEEKKQEIINKMKDFYKKLLDGNYECHNITIHYNKGVELIEAFKNTLKIVEIYDLNLEEIIEICNKVDISEDTEILTEYNYGDITYKSDIVKVGDYFSAIKDYVERFDLSPLEKCIFVFDLIKEREYKMSQSDDASESRSIFKTYNSDEIVCSGFSLAYKTVLNMMGITSEVVTYASSNKDIYGHMTNTVRLIDPKYNENCIFEVDSTWERSFTADDKYDYTSSVKNYTFFANSIVLGANYRKNKNGYDIVAYSDRTVNIFYNRKKRLVSLIELGAPNQIVANSLKILKDGIISVYEELNRDSTLIANELEELLNKIMNSNNYDTNEIKDLINNIEIDLFKSIDPHSFAKALIKVKLIEHSIDSYKYPFDRETYFKIINKKCPLNAEEKLLLLIFNERTGYEPDELEENLAKMKLISTLRNKTNDPIRENPFVLKK